MKLWEKQVVAKTGKIVRYFFRSFCRGTRGTSRYFCARVLFRASGAKQEVDLTPDGRRDCGKTGVWKLI